MTPNDPSPGVVATAVYSALAAHDLRAARAWQRHYTPPVNASVPEQIASANRFWRLQLADLPFSTTKVRECLVDEIELNDWVRNFCEGVVPTIIALKLPKA